MSVEKETIEKLKKILKVSNRIKLEHMKDVLEMDQKTFNKQIIDWADEFGFTIDGDYVIVNKESVNDFITKLDQQYKSWETREASGIGKIKESIIKKPTNKKTGLNINEKIQSLFTDLKENLKISPKIISLLSNMVNKMVIIEGQDEIDKIIQGMLNKVKSSINIITPNVRPEILQSLSESAYQRKAVRFLLSTNWDLAAYGHIIDKMKALGNLRFKNFIITHKFYYCSRDSEEALIGRIGESDEESVALLCDKDEIVQTFSEIGSKLLWDAPTFI